MHPVLRNPKWLAQYVAVWLGLGYMLAALLRVPGGALSWRDALAVAVPLCLFFAFVCLTPWYMCRQLPLVSANGLKMAVSHASAAILATALWIGLARAIGYVFEIGSRLDAAITPLIAVGLLLYLLSVALHYMMLAFETSRQAALGARDAELRALKAQINPHFLFNSLNSITALTTSDPGRAREMCIRLAEFLRNTLGLGERESVAWHEELDLAQAYLDVEQIRFGSRLQVEMHVDEQCADCLVPPLVLQPLVENAVKHGVATMVNGGSIRVDSRLRDGQLRVTVENCFDPESPAPRRHGMGLRNVRSRLETRFGSAGRLAARADGNTFRAEISVPCQLTD
ncbi:MAG TPA: histidine kinase [Bryobacteraceae bacterium]|nr:histidine kinase [Bryobacteraceae bacterium]